MTKPLYIAVTIYTVRVGNRIHEHKVCIPVVGGLWATLEFRVWFSTN